MPGVRAFPQVWSQVVRAALWTHAHSRARLRHGCWAADADRSKLIFSAGLFMTNRKAKEYYGTWRSYSREETGPAMGVLRILRPHHPPSIHYVTTVVSRGQLILCTRLTLKRAALARYKQSTLVQKTKRG